RTPTLWTTLRQSIRTFRLNPHYSDLNAAGSYYVLCLIPAGWLGFKRTFWWWSVAALIGLALWLTGSRSALVAGVVVLAAAWIIDRRPSLRTLVAAGLIVLVAAAVLMRPRGALQASPDETMRLRLELMRVGVRIAATHPVFGVGLGQFQSA